MTRGLRKIVGLCSLGAVVLIAAFAFDAREDAEQEHEDATCRFLCDTGDCECRVTAPNESDDVHLVAIPSAMTVHPDAVRNAVMADVTNGGQTFGHVGLIGSADAQICFGLTGPAECESISDPRWADAVAPDGKRLLADLIRESEDALERAKEQYRCGTVFNLVRDRLGNIPASVRAVIDRDACRSPFGRLSLEECLDANLKEYSNACSISATGDRAFPYYEFVRMVRQYSDGEYEQHTKVQGRECAIDLRNSVLKGCSMGWLPDGTTYENAIYEPTDDVAGSGECEAHTMVEVPMDLYCAQAAAGMITCCLTDDRIVEFNAVCDEPSTCVMQRNPPQPGTVRGGD